MQALLDSPRYRRFLAETHPDLAIDDDRLDGVPSFLAPLDVREPLLRGPVRWVLDAARPLARSLITPTALFLGTPFERYDQSALLETIPSVRELTERALCTARSVGARVVVLTNVRSDAIPDREAWSDLGWARFPSFPDTVVDLAPPSLASHLATLPSGDRSGMRRNIRRFERAGHHLERIEAAGDLGPALYRCYRPFYDKAAVRWQAHTQAYFAGLPDLGPSVRLTAARNPSGELIGFVVAFEDRAGVQAGRIGVHPDYHRRDAVYFRLLYHVLEEALTAHREGSWLSLEPTGYRMKRHLGARLVPLVNLILGVSDSWSILLRGGRGLGAAMLRHLQDQAVLERRY